MGKADMLSVDESAENSSGMDNCYVWHAVSIPGDQPNRNSSAFESNLDFKSPKSVATIKIRLIISSCELVRCG